MQECDFDRLMKQSGYQDLVDYYNERFSKSNISIQLIDFRELKSKSIDGINHSYLVESKGKIIDLGSESEFFGEPNYFFKNMRVTSYDPAILKEHHNSIKNEYYINECVLDADVIINMPKPKTHRKAGVTISMKNMVGINCRKEFLPHHTNGSLSDGGDEYLHKSFWKKVLDVLCDKRNYYSQTKKKYGIVKILNKAYGLVGRIVSSTSLDSYYEGNWYGNDTISRTIVDLNKIIMYADKNGVMQDAIQRKQLIVADMVISGEQEGPLAPSPKQLGIIAIGEDSVCFDEAILFLMGAKKKYINTVIHGRSPKGKYRITDEQSKAFLISNDKKYNNKYVADIDEKDKWFFVPTDGWKEAFYSKSESTKSVEQM